MMGRAAFAPAMLCVAALAGCGEKAAEAPPIRPVLSVVLEEARRSDSGFTGTIQPQYQTDRGFRVVGRITAREVYAGDVVTQGQTLAQLDPLLYQLSVRSSQADLANAQSQLANAAAAEGRTKALFERKVVSQADLDTVQQTREAAAASVQKAQANLDKAREQLGYTTLKADFDGVVASVDAEVGQTVSPGKKVLTLARIDIREAVVDVPEVVGEALAPGAPFEITLQVDPAVKATGKAREIAPQSDAATRTRRIRITLDAFTEAFRLGVTITAIPAGAGGPSFLELPRSAILEQNGASRVWLVGDIKDEVATVRSAPVEVAAADGNAATMRITGGVPAGARVVIAGVRSLSEGQRVKIWKSGS